MNESEVDREIHDTFSRASKRAAIGFVIAVVLFLAIAVGLQTT